MSSGRFMVTANAVVNPAAWATQGYGPAVTSTRVNAVVRDFLRRNAHPGSTLVVDTRLVRGTTFSVYLDLRITTPWWKLGFGSRTSRQEATALVYAAFDDFATLSHVEVKSVR